MSRKEDSRPPPKKKRLAKGLRHQGEGTTARTWSRDSVGGLREKGLSMPSAMSQQSIQVKEKEKGVLRW